MRARIALRKLGVLPAQDPELEETLVNEEVVKMRKKIGQEPDQRDVLQALRRGDEVRQSPFLRPTMVFLLRYNPDLRYTSHAMRVV